MLRPLFSPMIQRRTIQKLTIYNNPYRAQKPWPPDFTKLHPRYQFRFEKKYRRRSKLKWARPRWTKAVKLTAVGLPLFIAVYSVLFMDWGDMYGYEGKKLAPFAGIREWFFTTTSSIWSTSPQTPAPRSQVEPSLKPES